MSQAATEYDFHPLAEGYPLMSEAELERLADSIERRGQEQDIVLWNDRILDGRNRYLACKKRGIEPRFVDRSDVPENDLPALLEALNEHRRHLTPEQRRTLEERREAAKAALRESPERSNRQVAEQSGLDHKTVADVREELETRGEIPTSEQRTDARGRKQPARKKRGRPPKAKPAPGQAAATPAEPASPAPTQPGDAVPIPPLEKGMGTAAVPAPNEPVLFYDPPPEPRPATPLPEQGPYRLRQREVEDVWNLVGDEERDQLGEYLQSMLDRAAKVERVRCARLALRLVDRFPGAHMALRVAEEAILALG